MHDEKDVRLYHGDCLEILPGLDTVDAIVTDPPYGLKFMGKKWDHNVPSVEVWQECLHILKPGGYLLAFAGTRTQHRMACAIEDAGFEIRDMIIWVYSQGFPKAKGVLKPSLEPITVARKPFTGSCAANVLKHGTGNLNVDECRVGPGHENGQGRDGETSSQTRYTDKGATNIAAKPGPRGGDPRGRWPANLIHDGSEEVTDLFPWQTSGAAPTHRNSTKFKNSYGVFQGQEELTERWETNSGSAARFFYCAKANKKERGDGNTHPTVKPIALMQYLCRLVTPPGGIILDPFTGSGSTGIAAIREGFKFIGIELMEEYHEIAVRRIEKERQ